MSKQPKPTVFVCTNYRPRGNSCSKRGSEKIAKKLEEFGVSVVKQSCFGRCSFGPVMKIQGGEFHFEITERDLKNIADEAKQKLSTEDDIPLLLRVK